MHFTQEDYIKIENWLHRNSVKDTEFQEALPFTGKEIVTVIQDGHNRKVNIQEFINQLYKNGVEDFLNVTTTYRANNITLKEAIRLIPAEARKEGQVITFLNTDGNWEIYQFIGKLNQWNNPTLWNNPFDWEKFVVDSILPDEEDLTKSAPDAKGNSYLSLKDRKYEPDKYSGLGRKILRRRVIEIEDPVYGTQEKNLLLQADFAEDNTVYVVRYDFTLNGQDITLPDNSYIEYEGGSISDGNIIEPEGGLSRIILRKNNINGVNLLTQDMLSNDNTIYIIKYEFDLNNNTIKVPKNCTLYFDGGLLKDGLLEFNNSTIVSNTKCFENIIFKGSFNKEFYLKWVGVMEENEDNYQVMLNLHKYFSNLSKFTAVLEGNIKISTNGKIKRDEFGQYVTDLQGHFIEEIPGIHLLPNVTYVGIDGTTLEFTSEYGDYCLFIEKTNKLSNITIYSSNSKFSGNILYYDTRFNYYDTHVEYFRLDRVHINQTYNSDNDYNATAIKIINTNQDLSKKNPNLTGCWFNDVYIKFVKVGIDIQNINYNDENSTKFAWCNNFMFSNLYIAANTCGLKASHKDYGVHNPSNSIGLSYINNYSFQAEGTNALGLDLDDFEFTIGAINIWDNKYSGIIKNTTLSIYKIIFGMNRNSAPSIEYNGDTYILSDGFLCKNATVINLDRAYIQRLYSNSYNEHEGVNYTKFGKPLDKGDIGWNISRFDERLDYSAYFNNIRNTKKLYYNGDACGFGVVQSSWDYNKNNSFVDDTVTRFLISGRGNKTMPWLTLSRNFYNYAENVRVLPLPNNYFLYEFSIDLTGKEYLAQKGELTIKVTPIFIKDGVNYGNYDASVNLGYKKLVHFDAWSNIGTLIKKNITNDWVELTIKFNDYISHSKIPIYLLVYSDSGSTDLYNKLNNKDFDSSLTEDATYKTLIYNGFYSAFTQVKSGGETRPTLEWGRKGFEFFDDNVKKPIWWEGSKWIDAMGNLPTKNYGTTENRPTGLSYDDIGIQYFDRTIMKPIWWAGSGWVDATGVSV